MSARFTPTMEKRVVRLMESLTALASNLFEPPVFGEVNIEIGRIIARALAIDPELALFDPEYIKDRVAEIDGQDLDNRVKLTLLDSIHRCSRVLIDRSLTAGEHIPYRDHMTASINNLVVDFKYGFNGAYDYLRIVMETNKELDIQLRKASKLTVPIDSQIYLS